MKIIKNWLPAIVAGIVLGLNLIINIPGLPIFLGLPLVVWLIFVLVVIQFIFREKEISQYKNTNPNIEFVNAITKQLPVTEYHHKYDIEKDMLGGTATITYAYLPSLRTVSASADFDKVSDNFAYSAIVCENKKVEGKRIVTAEAVHGRMFFYNEKLESILAINGIDARWADTIEPTYSLFAPREKRYYLEMDIPAGAERELCVAIKNKNEDNCYIFNLETYSQNKLRLPESAIIIGKYYIMVVLKGMNMPTDKEGWFELNNPGRGTDFTIRTIEDPRKGKKKGNLKELFQKSKAPK